MTLKMYVKAMIGIIIVMVTNTVYATEVAVWNQKPIEIRLEVGKERLIEFPDNIMLGLPQKVKSRLRVSSAAGVAYLTPTTTFPKTRVQVKLVSTNEIVFVDLFSVEPTDDSDLELLKIITNDEKKATEESEQEIFEETEDLSIKRLVQYAAHDFFAPPRLKEKELGVRTSDITKPLDLRLLFTKDSAGLFTLKALRQYRTYNYTLTAVLLTNRTYYPQQIVYSDITTMTDFEVISSQHVIVGAKGSSSQSTILYLVTKQPLDQIEIFSL